MHWQQIHPRHKFWHNLTLHIDAVYNHHMCPNFQFTVPNFTMTISVEFRWLRHTIYYHISAAYFTQNKECSCARFSVKGDIPARCNRKRTLMQPYGHVCDFTSVFITCRFLYPSYFNIFAFPLKVTMCMKYVIHSNVDAPGHERRPLMSYRAAPAGGSNDSVEGSNLICYTSHYACFQYTKQIFFVAN